jgi:signal transduction histidine kinase
MTETLALAAAYVAVGRWGLTFDPVSRVATSVWPPTGLALAALVLGGRSLWPGVAIGAFLVNLSVGVSVPTALTIATGNTLEALLGATLLLAAGFHPALSRVRDVLLLLSLSALLSTTVSATGGILALRLGGVQPDWGKVWRVWWLGDAMGALLVAPLLFILSQARTWERPRLARVIEGIGVAATIAGVGVLVFGLDSHKLTYLLFPPLIWAALRFGQPGAVMASFLSTAITIGFTAQGIGPFATGAMDESLFMLQSFMAVVVLTAITLGAAVEERRRAVRAREEILGIVSHDLKNPLANILLRAQTLSRRPGVGEVARKESELIHQSAERMHRLIDDMVDFASIQAGRLAMDRRPHVPTQIVDEALQTLEPIAREKGIQLRPPARKHELPLIHCDRDRVLEVFFNLIGNAVAFTPPGGQISVDVEPRGNEVLFSVSDTGPGIPPEHLETIFDRYWRGPTEHKGSGLGLAITRGIVHAHAGRIWADNPPGQGARLSFTLPVAAPVGQQA